MLTDAEKKESEKFARDLMDMNPTRKQLEMIIGDLVGIAIDGPWDYESLTTEIVNKRIPR